MFGCFKIDGKEWTVQAKCYCLADTMEEAIKKSNKLQEKGILTIARSIYINHI